jgi:hypothetical protein
MKPFNYQLNSKMLSPVLRFSLMSGKRFSRNLGLRVLGYSVKNNAYVTDKLRWNPNQVPIKAFMGSSYIDVSIGFNETMPKNVYNIIIAIDELTLRDGSNATIPEISNNFVAPDVFNIEKKDFVVEICPLI